MVTIIAEYEIKEGSQELVLKELHNFLEKIHALEPNAEYSAMQVTETNKFIHTMTFQSMEEAQRHGDAEHTQKFKEFLLPHCIDGPTYRNLHKVV